MTTNLGSAVRAPLGIAQIILKRWSQIMGFWLFLAYFSKNIHIPRKSIHSLKTIIENYPKRMVNLVALLGRLA